MRTFGTRAAQVAYACEYRRKAWDAQGEPAGLSPRPQLLGPCTAITRVARAQRKHANQDARRGRGQDGRPGWLGGRGAHDRLWRLPACLRTEAAYFIILRCLALLRS